MYNEKHENTVSGPQEIEEGLRAVQSLLTDREAALRGYRRAQTHTRVRVYTLAAMIKLAAVLVAVVGLIEVLLVVFVWPGQGHLYAIPAALLFGAAVGWAVAHAFSGTVRTSDLTKSQK